MEKEQNKYEQLLQQGVSRETLNGLLHKLIMLEKKGVIPKQERRSKGFRRVLQALLNYLFARKPKNPV